MREQPPELPLDDWDALKPTLYLQGIETTAPITTALLTLLYCVIFLISSSLNTLFLIIYLRKPSLRNLSNRFIVSLTISNLLSSWVLLPLVVTDLFLTGWNSLPESSRSLELTCVSINMIADMATSASVFGTVLIALDRFIAITDPLHYHQLVTKGRSWIFIGLCWSLALVIATFSGIMIENGHRWNICQAKIISSAVEEETFPYWSLLSYAVGSFVLCFALPLIVLSWAYFKIYSAAQQNSERTRKGSLGTPSLEILEQLKAASRSSSLRSTSSQIVSTIRRRFSNASLFLYKEEARAAKISIGVITLFIICWFPFYLFQLVNATLGQKDLPIYLFKVVVIFSLFNSAISPYVYMYRSKRIQKEVLLFFGVQTKDKGSAFGKNCPPYSRLPKAQLEQLPSSASSVYLNGSCDIDNHSANAEDGRMVNKDHLITNLLLKIFKNHLWKGSVDGSSSSHLSSSFAYLSPPGFKTNLTKGSPI